jgi:tetratricopeptide (TPR) repeat protein
MRRASELSPAAIACNRGCELAEAGQRQKAAMYFRKALRLPGAPVEAHVNLSSLLVDEGKSAQALSHARMAVDLAPEYAQAHYVAARALLAMDMRFAAIGYIRSFLAHADADDDGIPPARCALQSCVRAVFLMGGRSP